MDETLLSLLNKNNAKNRTTPAKPSVPGRFRIGVRQARCVTWCPRTGGLWTGGQDGLVLCDRFLGRHTVSLDDVPVAMALSRDGETGIVVGQSGRLFVLQRVSSTAIPHVRTGLHGRIHAFRSRGRFYVSGVGPRGGRLFQVLQNGARRIAKLPDGAACGPGRHGPLVVRLLDGQPVLTEPDATCERASDSGHALVLGRRHLLSWTSTAICVRGKGDPATVLVDGTSTCDFDPRRRRLAIGTLDGRVGVVDLDNVEHRTQPTLQRMSRTPIRAVRFSPDGGHLATLSDEADIWDMGGGDW